MSGHFTDRDERMWQQRAEERAARPVPIGTWFRALRRRAARARVERDAATPTPRAHACEPA
ncbi:hypothetical protein [Streptomyces sp. NPDC002825]|uniref:hypothetical protein n=1 Tax=Streptomyces sp. NPDC002825 TaxID=3154666 RepID=UPI00332B5052